MVVIPPNRIVSIMDSLEIPGIQSAVQVSVNLRIPLEETDVEAARKVRPDKVILI